jgi:primosomal protein N' (replication factor Y)
MVDSPLPQLDRLFDYRIPATLIDAVRPGVRVRVPLRSAGRIADGFVVELVEQGDYAGPLSDVESVVSSIPVLTAEVAELARAASTRAAGSAIDIVRLAVPGRQVRVEKSYLAAEHPALEALPATHPGKNYEGDAFRLAIAENRRLAVDAVPFVAELPNGKWVGSWAITMADAASLSVESGRSAILAVPDYRDQDQLMEALSAILPDERIVRLDSRQSNPERYRNFLRCLSDDALVIVGNRSVVYAPTKTLGLIAVWDDGDPLHSEPLAPYVHTRDAALLRQEQQGCALIFLAHSRSTEVQRLVEIGWLSSVSPHPIVVPRVVPTANQSTTDRLAAQARIPSTAWRAVKSALESGPVLVQVARPGYSPQLACVDCGQTARCVRCEGPLHQRRASAVPSCAWCGALAVDWHCERCQGTRLRLTGAAGATRTADELGRAFPGVRVIVADGERSILTVGAEPALVIATRGAEPIASGGYRAILLLDGERMIARESLRVAEDCLRWWANAIALGAPGAVTMLVGVGGALASALATWNLAAYSRGELADRRRLRFPPAVRVATITGTESAVSAAVSSALAALAKPADGTAVVIPSSDVLGPVDTEPGSVRTILRFDYAPGARVAAALRAEVIRSATSRRRTAGKSGPPRAAAQSLRVRFDDVEPFLD